ncbi:MAG: sulfotransferase [Acidobacteriota bacterium]
MSRTVIREGTGESARGPIPYLFVVGCPRSGTTLLQRMLDNHPQLAVANDTHFIPRVIKRLPTEANPTLTPDLVERVRSYHRFGRLGLSEPAFREAAAQARTYADFVSTLYREYAEKRGKPLAGEKTPDYVRHLPRLHCLFPRVKSLHIIRDGRDVALSTLQWAHEKKGPGRLALWKKEPVAVCALWWRWLVGTGRRDGKDLGPDHYSEVFYEKLVNQCEETLRRMTTFLKLPFAPEMLAFHRGKTRRKPGLSAKKAWLPPTPGLRDWRTQMKESDVELFEAIAGDLLSALGYERATRTASPTVAERAQRCLDWWTTEMARRGIKADARPASASQA